MAVTKAKRRGIFNKENDGTDNWDGKMGFWGKKTFQR